MKMTNTISSRNVIRRCLRGILTENAKTSSMNVLKVLYMSERIGKCATLRNL